MGAAMRRRGKLFIWPQYFDSSYSWREGRRVPRSLALRSPRAEDIEKTAQELGLNPMLTPGAAHPKYPQIKTGVVLVDAKAPKTQILKDIAAKIRGR